MYAKGAEPFEYLYKYDVHIKAIYATPCIPKYN